VLDVDKEPVSPDVNVFKSNFVEPEPEDAAHDALPLASDVNT